MQKRILLIFFVLVLASLLTPFWVFTQLQFPYITSKAFYFRVIIELALPFYVYLLATNKNLRPKLKNPLNLAVLIFFVINLLTAFTGVNMERSLWGNFERMGGVYYLAHLTLLYFYVQLLGKADGNYIKRFLQGLIIISVLVTLNGLSGKIGGPKLVLDPSLPDRVSSTFGNPIFFASFLIIPLFLAAYFAISEEKNILKVVYWAAAIFQGLGIYFSGTRGAAVGLVIGIIAAAIFYTAFTQNSKLKKRGFLALGIFAILVFSLFYFHNRFPPGSTLHRLSNLRDSNTEARLIQWKMAINGFKDKPVLGTGPENYYAIFSANFNPEINKYDASWFDKPHNFLLEALTTNGVFGFAAYLAMTIFAFYGLWRGFKSGFLTTMETSLLVAAIVTYQVQNLFVFDTVSASVIFYAFFGFLAYIWRESGEEKVVDQKQKILKSSGYGVLGFAVVASLLLIYFSNIQSIQAAKATNYGFAYSKYDPKIAANFFDRALKIPLNMDRRETANRYSDFAADIFASDYFTSNKEFVLAQLTNARNVQKIVVEKNNNDPLVWMRLAKVEMSLAMATGQPLQEAKYAVDKAVSLSPKRADLIQLESYYYSYLQDWKGSVEVAKKMAGLYPENLQAKWQLAMAYYLNDQPDTAAQVGDEAVEAGIKFENLRQFAWYIQYYETKKNYAKLAPLLEKAIVLEPNEISLYFELAKTYAALGNTEKARALAQQVIISNPSQKTEVEKFLNSLPK